MKRNVWIGLAILSLVIALGFGSVALEKKAAVQAAGVQAPMFEVDPMWPKPMPNHWVIGMTIGVSVDAQDNVWIIHRGGSLEAKENVRRYESSRSRVLRDRAAGPGIR